MPARATRCRDTLATMASYHCDHERQEMPGAKAVRQEGATGRAGNRFRFPCMPPNEWPRTLIRARSASECVARRIHSLALRAGIRRLQSIREAHYSSTLPWILGSCSTVGHACTVRRASLRLDEVLDAARAAVVPVFASLSIDTQEHQVRVVLAAQEPDLPFELPEPRDPLPVLDLGGRAAERHELRLRLHRHDHVAVTVRVPRPCPEWRSAWGNQRVPSGSTPASAIGLGPQLPIRGPRGQLIATSNSSSNSRSFVSGEVAMGVLGSSDGGSARSPGRHTPQIPSHSTRGRPAVRPRPGAVTRPRRAVRSAGLSQFLTGRHVPPTGDR